MSTVSKISAFKPTDVPAYPYTLRLVPAPASAGMSAGLYNQWELAKIMFSIGFAWKSVELDFAQSSLADHTAACNLNMEGWASWVQI